MNTPDPPYPLQTIQAFIVKCSRCPDHSTPSHHELGAQNTAKREGYYLVNGRPICYDCANELAS